MNFYLVMNFGFVDYLLWKCFVFCFYEINYERLKLEKCSINVVILYKEVKLYVYWRGVMIME